MRVQVDQASGPRDRRVIRGVLLQPHPHKLPQRQRVRQSPGYPTLTVDALEISDQQTPKVDPRRKGRPPELRRIELRTPLFHELIELLSFQQFVELLVERMSRSRGHLRLGNPYPFLLLSLLARPHRHGRIIQTMPVNSSKLYRFMHQDLHHGLIGEKSRVFTQTSRKYRAGLRLEVVVALFGSEIASYSAAGQIE